MSAKDRMKQLRQGHGMTQADLAEASGVSIRMIQYYEQGKNDLNRAEALTVWRLSEALRCNIKELLDI